jgi:hypothetical protein
MAPKMGEEEDQTGVAVGAELVTLRTATGRENLIGLP